MLLACDLQRPLCDSGDGGFFFTAGEDALLCARMLRSCMMKVNSAAGDSEGRALGI